MGDEPARRTMYVSVRTGAGTVLGRQPVFVECRESVQRSPNVRAGGDRAPHMGEFWFAMCHTSAR
jgi:hypothetical protein